MKKKTAKILLSLSGVAQEFSHQPGNSCHGDTFQYCVLSRLFVRFNVSQGMDLTSDEYLPPFCCQQCHNNDASQFVWEREYSKFISPECGQQHIITMGQNDDTVVCMVCGLVQCGNGYNPPLPPSSNIKPRDTFKGSYQRRAYLMERFSAVQGYEPTIPPDDMYAIKREYEKYSNTSFLRQARRANGRVDKRDIQQVLRSLNKKHPVECILDTRVVPKKKKNKSGEETIFEKHQVYVKWVDLPEKENKWIDADKVSTATTKKWTTKYLERWQSISCAIFPDRKRKRYTEDEVGMIGALLMRMSAVWSDWQSPFRSDERDKFWKFQNRKDIPNINFLVNRIEKVLGIKGHQENWPEPKTKSSRDKLNVYWEELAKAAKILPKNNLEQSKITNWVKILTPQSAEQRNNKRRRLDNQQPTAEDGPRQESRGNFVGEVQQFHQICEGQNASEDVECAFECPIDTSQITIEHIAEFLAASEEDFTRLLENSKLGGRELANPAATTEESATVRNFIDLQLTNLQREGETTCGIIGHSAGTL